MDIFNCNKDQVLALYDSLSSEEKMVGWFMSLNSFMYDHKVVRGLIDRAQHDDLCDYDPQCACVACISKVPDKSEVYKHHALASYFKHPPNKNQIELYAFRCVISINLNLWSTAADFYELANLHPPTFKELLLNERNAFDFIEKHWEAARLIQKIWRRHSTIKKRIMIAKVCKSKDLSPNIAHIIWSHQTIFV